MLKLKKLDDWLDEKQDMQKIVAYDNGITPDRLSKYRNHGNHHIDEDGNLYAVRFVRKLK